jgi:thiol-disulfide isomerase/thioredoxin
VRTQVISSLRPALGVKSRRGFLLGLFIAGLLALAASPGPKAELNLKSMDGQRVRLSDYRGRVVVLNFWATWCIPCTAEIPMLVKVEKDYRKKGVAFIAASADDRKSRKNVPEFVSKYNVSLSIWLDAKPDDLTRLGMGAAVPATAFLDPEGHIAFRVEGQLREGEVRERLDWLLGSRAGSAPGRMRKASGDQVQP